MEILYYLSAICLLLFMILATYDGFYLHIWKYELFNRKESVFEHKTHTIRAIFFPIIVWLLFISNETISFWIGIIFVLFDLVVLGIDAYSEEDSRKSIGGLPKWEYILHLFANSFHFASIMLLLATKIEIVTIGLKFNESIHYSFGKELVELIAINIIPGAILLAIIHIILLNTKSKKLWNKNRNKIKCC